MTKKLIIAIVLVIGVSIGAFFVYSSRSFRVVEVIPAGNTLPTSAQNIIIRFSHNLDTNIMSDNTFEASPDIIQDVSIIDNEINIRLSTTLGVDDVLEISFTAHSVESKTINETLTFNTRYINPANQSPELLDIGVAESDSFETDYPLITKLPFIGDSFEIDYRFPDSSSSVMPIVISVRTDGIPRPSENTSGDDPSYVEYVDRIRLGRDSALQYLDETNLYNDDRYQIYVTEPLLLEEFDAILFEN